MKPAPFDIVRVNRVEDACRMLDKAGFSGRVVAGAQSLGPMLNLRLAQPRTLIDVTGIPELTRVSDASDAVTLGACVTTANIEDGKLPGRGLEHLPAVAMRIAYRAVRNRGTIGGSLCHADPSADWVCVLAVLGAECHITGLKGSRRLAADLFVTGAYQTALAADEVLEAVTIPRLRPTARFGYFKVCRKPGEFALAMSAVLTDPDRDVCRIVIGATKGRPIIIPDGRKLMRAGEPSALLSLLDRHGIAERNAQRQQMAAVARAIQQTLQ